MSKQTTESPTLRVGAGETTRRSPTGIDLSMLSGLIGYNLRCAYFLQVQRVTTVFGPFNIRPVQFATLSLIYHNPRLRQSELGRALAIKRPNIVTLVDELENRGLVDRRAAPGDKRSHVLHLTPAGIRLTVKLLDIHARLEQNIQETLSARERHQLLKLLKTFCRLDPAPDLGIDFG